MSGFYDELSPYYHLIYQDWEASVERQGQQLTQLIRERWGDGTQSILDVACGIGTQSLGLAAKGFTVTASDLSKTAVARACQEAEARELEIQFSVCDMRNIESHHPAGFDVVLCADNSIPHLLTDEEICSALRAMHSRLRPGGGCILTMRDYAKEGRGRGIVKPYGVREVDGVRYLVWQVWDFEGEQYVVSMYFVEDNMKGSEPRTRVMRSRYYAIPIDRMLMLMGDAGFQSVERLNDVYFQPVLVGAKGA